jgi:hypothetical protein
MISVVTPRIAAAVEQMNYAEIVRLDDAVTANNEELVMKMLCDKDFLIAFESDPILNAMMNDNVNWGDLMLAMPNSAKRVMAYKEVDPDANWQMPVLHRRKDIWENFPVVVVPMEGKGDRHVIRWHYKNYQETRQNCDNWCDYDDFEDNTYRRLLMSLSASRYWTVEEAAGNDDICVIAMNNFQEYEKTTPFKLPSNQDNDTESVGAKSTKSTNSANDGWETVPVKNAAAAAAAPVLRRLNDIKENFPVIWNVVPGKSTTYAVEIFGKKAREQGLNINKVKADLLTALKASKSWTVLPAKDDKIVCLIQMNHA